MILQSIIYFYFLVKGQEESVCVEKYNHWTA